MAHLRTKSSPGVGLQKEKQERSRNTERDLLESVAWICINLRCFEAKSLSLK